MTVNAGSIKYTVEAETGDLLTAEKVVDKTTDSMAKDFNKVDAAVKGTGKEFEKASVKIQASSAKMTKSAKGVNKATAGMGRGAGMAAVQVEQLIGSINAGQNPMRAFGFQAADMGIVLGFPLVGAIVGVAASLSSVFLPALFNSGESIDKLIEKMEEWKKSIGLTQEQIDFLTNKEIEANTVRAKTIAKYTEEINIIKIAIANQDILLAKKDLDIKVRKTLTKAQRESNKELSEKVALLQSETQAIVDSGKKIDTYNSSLNKGTDETKKQKEAVEALRSTLETQLVSLEQQVIALRDGEEAAFRWATAQRLGMKEGELFEESVDKRITALFKLKAAQDATSKETKAKEQLETQVQGLGVSPEDAIKIRLEKELELLQLAQEQKIEIEGTYQERRIELQKQADEKIAALNKKVAEDSIINYEALENQIIGTFASIASGAQDGKEAIASLAQSILTQMVGALIKMGIQSIISQTTTTAAGVANAGVLATAYAPAAAFASLASFGANAAPASAGIASTVALSQGLAISGGREFGGGVSGGNAYRMGENGPEILKQGNKQIVIPGENGQVIPNSQLGGGGGVTVNVNNMAPGIDIQTTPSSDGQTVDITVRRAIAEITNQVATGQGRFINALKSNTNVTSKASR